MEKVINRPKDKNKDEIKEPPMFKVIILNDNYSSFELVIFILMKIFHKSENDAKIATIQVHQSGSAIAGIYTADIAETKCFEAMAIARQNQMPLKLIVEESN